MSSHHRIRWKGRTTGPYSREEIRAKLAAGEFSLLHRVEISGQWVGLDEFLAGDRPVPPPRATTRYSSGPDAPADQSFITVHAPLRRPAKHVSAATGNRANLGYFLCGMCFVLPLAATLGACLMAWESRREGDTKQSDTLYILAALFTALGLAFWLAVFFAYSRDMI